MREICEGYTNIYFISYLGLQSQSRCREFVANGKLCGFLMGYCPRLSLCHKIERASDELHNSVPCMHAKGVVHGDINKFSTAINDDDTLHLIDFGHLGDDRSSVATDIWDGSDIYSKEHDNKAVQNLIGRLLECKISKESDRTDSKSPV